MITSSRSPLRLSASLLTVALAASPAHAEPPADARPRPPYQLRNTGAGMLALETLGVIGIFVAYSEAAGGLPSACAWCKPSGFDSSLRSALRSDSPRTAAWVSHGLSLGVVPLGSFAALLGPAISSGHTGYGLKDGWIMLNGLLLATALADGTKKLTARQRPAFHHNQQEATEARGDAGKLEQNQSFFSGDTAWAFSAASTATTLAYLRGYPTAPYIAAGGGALALTTGLLRIAADMHWATDVLAGAAVGTAIGVGLPLLLHRREPSSLQATPAAGGLAGVQMSGTF